MKSIDLAELDSFAVGVADCVRKPIKNVPLAELKIVCERAERAWKAYYQIASRDRGHCHESVRRSLASTLWRFQELLYELFDEGSLETKKEVWPYLSRVQDTLIVLWVFHERPESLDWMTEWLEREPTPIGDASVVNLEYEAALVGIRFDMANLQTAAAVFDLLSHLRREELAVT